jgi:hypothetical protein
VPVTVDPLAFAEVFGADFVPVTLDALDLVADLAAPRVALGLVAVIFVALAFFVVFLAAAWVGAAFFGGTALLAAEVAFFAAMLDPFKMALLRPREIRVSVRIGPSGPVLNGETPPRLRLVPLDPPEVGHHPGGGSQKRGASRSWLVPRLAARRRAAGQPWCPLISPDACCYLLPTGSPTPVWASSCS